MCSYLPSDDASITRLPRGFLRYAVAFGSFGRGQTTSLYPSACTAYSLCSAAIIPVAVGVAVDISPCTLFAAGFAVSLPVCAAGSFHFVARLVTCDARLYTLCCALALCAGVDICRGVAVARRGAGGAGGGAGAVRQRWRFYASRQVAWFELFYMSLWLSSFISCVVFFRMVLMLPHLITWNMRRVTPVLFWAPDDERLVYANTSGSTFSACRGRGAA